MKIYTSATKIMLKPCLYGSQQTVENFYKEIGIPDHLTCHLRNLYVDQEATVRTLQGTTGSKLGKKYIKVVYHHLAYLYAEYIMQNAGLDEAQAGIKIAERNINTLR